MFLRYIHYATNQRKMINLKKPCAHKKDLTIFLYTKLYVIYKT